MACRKLAHANSHLEKQIRFPSSCRTLYIPYRRGRFSKVIILGLPGSPARLSTTEKCSTPNKKHHSNNKQSLLLLQ